MCVQGIIFLSHHISPYHYHYIQNLIQIQDTFINFRELHVPKCPFIPTDIRQSYVSFRAQEEPETTIDDQFPWVSSAVTKGLRKDGRGKNHNIIIPCMQSIEIARYYISNHNMSPATLISIPTFFCYQASSIVLNKQQKMM